MTCRSPLLPSVGSAVRGATPPRAHPLRLLPTEGLRSSVTVPPQYPDRRRKRNADRDLQTRDDDRAADRIEKLAQQSWVEGAEPELPVRTTRPERVVFHLGPTNSGKTHDSLVALAENRSGVYAAPLRQLAHEAYARLSAQLPAGTPPPGRPGGGPRGGPPAPSVSPPARRRSTRTLRSSAAPWRRHRCAATSWCSTSRTGSPTPTAATTGRAWC